MRRLTLIVTAGTVLTVLSLVAGCSGGATKDPEYKRAEALPPLDVPPDLTTPVQRGNTSLPEIDAGRSTEVLPEQSRIEVRY